MKTALLIIDIQNDYFPGGKYPLVSPLEAAQKAYMILQCFREHGGYHIHIQHISKKPDATFSSQAIAGRISMIPSHILRVSQSYTSMSPIHF